VIAMDEPMLQFFAFAHLPERLQAVSEPFSHASTKAAVESCPSR
jgi:hypothetical protein